MPSLRKRVTSYFRQLSFHNEPRERRLNLIENTFINKYLQGEIRLKDGPPIIYGKNPTDLPNYDLAPYSTGPESIVGCYTGPNGGLTTVKRSEKHLCVLGDDIDFIDTAEETVEFRSGAAPASRSPNRNSDLPLDNSTMVIMVAGQQYHVTNNPKRRRHSKSHSLGSIKDFKIEVETTKRLTSIDNNNVIVKKTVTIQANEENELKDDDKKKDLIALSKSKSEGDPFGHSVKKTGKITRLAVRPTGDTSASSTSTAQNAQTCSMKRDPNLPPDWCVCSEHIYGISDSLYDKNLTTKLKNGDPIADCFGIIARPDSAILAVADGVNWGEKASVAAKSAIHGCLHYLNKTIFLDTKPFDSLIKNDVSKSHQSMHEVRISNTREVFVCLLRAFNCAHDLILENKGMLTTLTVAVILPLKSSPYNIGIAENYVCCVCNVGDTLAYVYSQKYGVRELTKGSHDINCNRDMRDALGALGPVDGINPELSNLTLSITTIQKGDIVLIASDGLTDNFDPNVCKFTINNEPGNPKGSSKPKEKKVTTLVKNRASSVERQPKDAVQKRVYKSVDSKRNEQSSTSTSFSNINNNVRPIKPPRKNQSSLRKTDNLKNVEQRDQKIELEAPKCESEEYIDPTDILKNTWLDINVQSEETAQKTTKNTEETVKTYQEATYKENQPTNFEKTQHFEPPNINEKPIRLKPTPPVKSASSKNIQQTKPTNYSFLRSKTSIDLRPKPQIHRNPDGIPFVTPLQRYELTLLLIEDILKRGISGKEHQCVTAKKLCENLHSFTVSITNAKRRCLEDPDLYYNSQNGVLVEVSHQEKKMRRKRGLEKVQNLPGKLDHVTVVACNVGNAVVGRD